MSRRRVGHAAPSGECTRGPARGHDGHTRECFHGRVRSRAQEADSEIVGNSVECVRGIRWLSRGLTIAVAFDKGFVHEPTALDKALLFLRSNWPLGLPFIVFVIMFYFW